MERGQGQGRSRRNSTFWRGAFKLLSELCRYQFSLSRIVERFVLLAVDPEMMQQNCQLASHCDDRAFLSPFASTFSQLQSPSPEIGVFSERPQNVLCPLHQHHAQIGVSLPGDMQLRLALSGVPSARLQSHVTACISALAEAPRVFQRQDVCQRDERAYTFDLLEQRHVRIAFLGELLDLERRTRGSAQ